MHSLFSPRTPPSSTSNSANHPPSTSTTAQVRRAVRFTLPFSSRRTAPATDQPAEYFSQRIELDPQEQELPARANRKWKRIASIHIRYNTAPFYFDEVMPDTLEGKLSNFIFTARIKEINAILVKKGTIKDVSHLWRNGISVSLMLLTVIMCAVLLRASFPVYFGICLLLFVAWSFAQACTLVEPKYEREIQALCKYWSQEDTHLHLGYISRRSNRPEIPSMTTAALFRTLFKPVETEWVIYVLESVAILPVQMYGIHVEDGSGWTAATIDSDGVPQGGERCLPPYGPAWDGTPAPGYFPDSVDKEQEDFDDTAAEPEPEPVEDVDACTHFEVAGKNAVPETSSTVLAGTSVHSVGSPGA
ncbi:hypothetical protein HDU78_008375 [Chytriomyces hyalinus]|nr:hypothetical protein HDU78_008375 [Chytriomyces hyalinus]